uniref:Biopolymer transport protein n=1 Tax=uncultured Latescibacterota bacterium TaxID=199737 RepID=Q2YZV7_9BACT|nr:biopolymer transport protein [uncultured Latescibacterota bacterium]
MEGQILLGSLLVVPAIPGYAGGDVFDMIIRAAAFSKIILLILFGFSVSSWAIILERWWFYKRAERRSLAFLQSFRRAASPQAFRTAVSGGRDNPFARIFDRALKQAENGSEDSHDAGYREMPVATATERTVATESLKRTLELATTEEIAVLERYLGFLATTGSTCPFIGLLGTVWGVMSSFMSMGREGSASLAVVAPGIAEALIVTAAGLFAAIPAVIGYNLYVNRVQRFTRRMDSFSLELLNALERNNL